MSIDFERLRAANLARQDEWAGNERADIAFRALEVADEAGEVAGAVKKLLRAQRGICGSTMTCEDVADEIGDTVISLDLLMLKLGVELPGDPVTRAIERDPALLMLWIDQTVGSLSGALVAHIRTASYGRSTKGTMSGICHFASELITLLEMLAYILGIDAGKAVRKKFDKTSVKYGLSTRMEVS